MTAQNSIFLGMTKTHSDGPRGRLTLDALASYELISLVIHICSHFEIGKKEDDVILLVSAFCGCFSKF